jgi:plastocyanin
MSNSLSVTAFILISVCGLFQLPMDRAMMPGTNAGGQDRTGAIVGKVELRSLPPTVRRERSGGYGTMGMAHEPEGRQEKISEQRKVVVYLEGDRLDTFRSQETGRAAMDQRQAAFVPHILAIQKGTVVDFTNHDKVYHNVFSLSSTKKFNIGRRPTGEAVPVQFEKAGVAQIFCDIHSQMTAFVVVLENPFFVEPADDGTFKIENVPPGTYTIKAWHERLSAPDQRITVTAGATSTANFVLE